MGLAERLGVERALILHVDDLAMCHGANRAYLELAAHGLVTCGSVMVPCPWFGEIAEAVVADPALDLGVHLTLTSEWAHYRWRPLSTTRRASGLIDDDGYFWRDVASLRPHLVVEAAEAELRAQIFEPFFTTRPGGTGLGLYIARELADANGAALELLPKGPGAHFRMTLKRAINPAQK